MNNEISDNLEKIGFITRKRALSSLGINPGGGKDGESILRKYYRITVFSPGAKRSFWYVKMDKPRYKLVDGKPVLVSAA